MKKIIKLSESDMIKLIKRVIKEQTEIDFDGKPMTSSEVSFDDASFTDVMDFAYEQMDLRAPDGPKNKKAYIDALNELDREFDLVIKNLKGNIR
jgi:hypothetical protein